MHKLRLHSSLITPLRADKQRLQCEVDELHEEKHGLGRQLEVPVESTHAHERGRADRLHAHAER